MNKTDFSTILKNEFDFRFHLILSELQINQFFDYYNFLVKENEKYNLTSILSAEEIIYKHFIDSCYIVLSNDFKDSITSVIDIGCGAGFPSIPLAILHPDIKFVLVDSVNKKINFIKMLCDKIHLTNVVAIHGRIEDLGHNPEYIEKFDCCVSRALSKINVLLEYASSILKINGFLFCYKLSNIDDEINISKKAQSILSLYQNSRLDYSINSSEPSRSIFSFVKHKQTPKEFPRKAGVPTKKPLQ